MTEQEEKFEIYEAPSVEQVIEGQDIAREVFYAGAGTTVPL